jgi:hypothetical protein
MKTYARVDQGVVMELLTTGDDIAEMFNPALVWIDITSVTPQPQQGWNYAEGAFTEPSES